MKNRTFPSEFPRNVCSIAEGSYERVSSGPRMFDSVVFGPRNAEGSSVTGVAGRWSSHGCVLYRKTLSEIYGGIIRDGVSESNRPLFYAPSIMLISIAARLMEEGGRRPLGVLASRSPDVLTFLPRSTDRA